ncbi:MAG: GNAT family N-acetyltransferase [Syntrophales bacterium]|jgi:acetyltransferase
MGHDDCAETWTLDDGSKLTLRHIAPADAAIEQAFVHGLSRQSSYLRFHGTIKDLSKKDLEKYTNPDSRNAVALIVVHSGETGEEEIGVARYSIDPDGASGEFAIVVADAWQKRGIGTRLMNALIRHLKASGVKRISGSVLKSNAAMRKFAKQMDFAETDIPDDPSILLVTKHLTD